MNDIANNSSTNDLNTSVPRGLMFASVLFGMTMNVQGASDAVHLDIKATVPATCSIDTSVNGSQLALGVLKPYSKTAAKASVEFQINCNSPFKYSFYSLNGKLTHKGDTPIAAGSDSFDQALGYDIAFTADVQDGDAGDSISHHCSSVESAQIDTCVTGNSGNAVAINQRAQLSISVDTHDAVPLAGEYEDQLNLVIMTRL